MNSWIDRLIVLILVAWAGYRAWRLFGPNGQGGCGQCPAGPKPKETSSHRSPTLR